MKIIYYFLFINFDKTNFNLSVADDKCNKFEKLIKRICKNVMLKKLKEKSSKKAKELKDGTSKKTQELKETSKK